MIRQIAPGCSRSQDPEMPLNTAVIHPTDTARLVGRHGLDDGPLMIVEFVAHDSEPPVWEFESQASSRTQCCRPGAGGSVLPKRTSSRAPGRRVTQPETRPNLAFFE